MDREIEKTHARIEAEVARLCGLAFKKTCRKKKETL